MAAFALTAGWLAHPLPQTVLAAVPPASASDRLRLIIETDGGGDPDDEQSLVRFLLYTSEWDVEAIIANRPQARDGENWNPERTGLGIVRRLLNAYGEVHPNLVLHDPRYPSKDHLWHRTVPGYNDSEEAVNRLIEVVDQEDARPVWYSDWGTDHGGATNNLKRALDRVRRERGEQGYARFKAKLRLVSADAFAEHTTLIPPPFELWVDTWRPEVDGRRWYHQFSTLTASAGGFDLLNDCLTGHGPLGALYPTNTTHRQKEGDSLSFIYLIPTGLGNPEDPTLGGWGGRLGFNERHAGRAYYWANQADRWNGVVHRDQTLARWAEAIQNDFKARLDWCVTRFEDANHPPRVRLQPGRRITGPSGQTISLDARTSSDPDGQELAYQWLAYPEAGTCPDTLPQIHDTSSGTTTVTLPPVQKPCTLHVLLIVTDSGHPPLSRYARVVIDVVPD